MKSELGYNNNRSGKRPQLITHDIILFLLKTGLEITWDGDSFAEVIVPPRFKSKMCGLCGNYNGDRLDDYLTKSGTLAPDIRTFADSWRLGEGDSESCDRTARTFEFSCERNSKTQRRANKECRVLKSRTFKACRGVVDMWVYYR